MAVKKRIVLGGPAYGMKCDARHADTITYLAMYFQSVGWKVDVWHRHSSILVENRDALLRGCIEKQVDVFLSIDADTYLADDGMMESVKAIGGWADAMHDHQGWRAAIEKKRIGLYAACAPVRQRNGKWNVVDKDGHHYDSLPSSNIRIPDDGQWCAFAFSLFNCAAYVEWYMRREPFFQFGFARDRLRLTLMAEPVSELQPWIGEDSYHSMRVAQLEGYMVVDPSIKTEHAV